MLMFQDLETRDFRLKAFDLSFWLMPFGSMSLGIMALTPFCFVTASVCDNHMERKGRNESRWVWLHLETLFWKQTSHQELTWQASFPCTRMPCQWLRPEKLGGVEKACQIPDATPELPKGFCCQELCYYSSWRCSKVKHRCGVHRHREWLFKRPVIVPAAKYHPEIGTIWTLLFQWLFVSENPSLLHHSPWYTGHNCRVVMATLKETSILPLK